MKRFLILSLLIVSSLAVAETKTSSPEAFHEVSQENSACRKKVEKLIISRARKMGLKAEFGIPDISQESAGNDSTGHALAAYRTGVFIIDDGYISDSGATVTVRSESCEVVKIDISIGHYKPSNH